MYQNFISFFPQLKQLADYRQPRCPHSHTTTRSPDPSTSPTLRTRRTEPPSRRESAPWRGREWWGVSMSQVPLVEPMSQRKGVDQDAQILKCQLLRKLSQKLKCTIDPFRLLPKLAPSLFLKSTRATFSYTLFEHRTCTSPQLILITSKNCSPALNLLSAVKGDLCFRRTKDPEVLALSIQKQFQLLYVIVACFLLIVSQLIIMELEECLPIETLFRTAILLTESLCYRSQMRTVLFQGSQISRAIGLFYDYSYLNYSKYTSKSLNPA